MIDLDELNRHLEVQINIREEKRVADELYKRGVKAMADALGKESQ